MTVVMQVWRGISALPSNRIWPETWARRPGSTLRALWTAGATLCQMTVGVGAIRLHCLIAGHDDGYAREPNRLFLRCADCGRTTHGWAITSSAPRITAPVVRRRPVVVAARAR